MYYVLLAASCVTILFWTKLPQPFTINHSLAEGGLSFTAVTNVLVSQCKTKALLFVLTFYVNFCLQIRDFFGKAESSVSFSVLVMVSVVSFSPSPPPSQAIEKVYLGRAIKSNMDCIQAIKESTVASNISWILSSGKGKTRMSFTGP